MHWCEPKKVALNGLEVQDSQQNPYSKICGQMYKRLQREHLLLQRSFLTVYQTLNENLTKSKAIEEYVSDISESIKSEECDSFSNITNPKPEKKSQLSQLSQVHQTQHTEQTLLESSIPEIVYKKLSKEHLTLQRSFTSVCHSLREALDKSQRPKQQKIYNKDSDELKREIELLKLELQESRDQNELFEFRIHELEQIKEIACIKCCKLETQLSDTNNENQKLNEKLIASKRVLNDLIVKYGLKDEQNLLLHKNYNKIDAIDRNRYLCSAMTSEDEGLGDDSRRDHSSGPSSLADMQECDYDVMSEKSSQVNVQNNVSPPLKRSICLQTDSFPFECQNLRLTEEVNKNRDWIEKLEKNLKQMREERANLQEQVLELEEAENDARLVSQRLQQQLKTFADRYETIQLDLINANKTIDFNNNRIESFDKIEAELRAQLEDIRSILLKQSFIDNNCYRNEHNFLEENNKKYSNSRLNALTKEDTIPDQCRPPIDGLFSFLWEKLYRIETQIDCLQQSYGQSLESFASDETDEDLQLFISAENLSEVSKIGSSFEVSHFLDHCGQSYCQSDTQCDESVLSTPLCETIKPEKIDISLDNYWHSKASLSSNQCLFPEINDKIFKLESNEQNLRQRLLQLESINKEFIRELEIREKLFFRRESHQKEWLNSEIEFKNSIYELQSQLNYLGNKSKEIGDQINCLDQKIISFTEEEDNYETQKNSKSNHENNSIINLEKLLNGLEIKFNLFLTSNQSPEEISGQNNIKNEDNLIITELKEMFTKMNEQFSQKINFIEYNNCPKNEIRRRIEDMESEKVIFNNQLTEISEKEIILQTYLNVKQNELKKARQTHESKIESLSEEHKRIEKGLRLKMKEMEEQTSTTVNELEGERNQIMKDLSQFLNNIQSNELEYRKKINKLNESVVKIETKISKLVEFESNLNKLKAEKVKLKVEINSVQSSEEQLKKKLNEMTEKESAYKETLSKADKIIGSLEHNYKQRINDLEASEVKLKTRITNLEDSEMRLRSSLRTERRNSDSYGKASDLVQQLIDSEARESTLKQQIKGLEIKINELEHNLEEMNQTKSRFESELKDQDELLSNVHQLKLQNESLKKDFNKSLQSQDSIQNMLKETEKYYQQRDEEMQNQYKSLEDQKCSLELTIQHLKHSLRHSQNTGHSFASFSDNNSMELKIIQNIDDSNDNNLSKNSEKSEENFETKSKNITKPEELDQTFLNVEKCLKRAMAVITLEIKQKDIEEKTDSPVVALNGENSLKNVKNIKNLKVLVQTKNGCSSKPSKSSQKWSTLKTPSPPKNFRILKKVSSDSLLIGWQNNNKDEYISGYQILVNEVLVKRVQNPNATKSLVRKLDLNQSFEMKIKSISCCGQLSDEVITEYLPICWTQSLNESTDYTSDSSDSSESTQSSGANQMTRL